jgi:hypothetical protein
MLIAATHTREGMNDIYELIYALSDESDLFYSSDNPEHNNRIGCIGRLRADFGKSGNEFWSTWMDFSHELKTPDFSGALDNVINTLRNGGILTNRAIMSAHCANHPQSRLDDSRGNNYGFKIKTVNYVYYLRCITNYGDYNFYCYAYNRSRLEKSFSHTCG